MKKLLCILLALAMTLTLTACGGSKDKSVSAGTENTQPAAEDAAVETENEQPAAESAAQPLAAVDYVQAAMDAADHLTSGSYFLLEDGTILNADYGSAHEHASVYAAMPSVQKLVDTCSEMELFALTESGELYYRDAKIMEGVSDMIYCTNNYNQEAIAAVGPDIYKVYVTDYDPARETDNGNVNVGAEAIRFYPVTDKYVDLESGTAAPEGARFVQVASDKHNYMALTDQGKLYLPTSDWDAEELQGLTCGSWDDLVLVDLMRETNSDTGAVEVTVAGIQADGTVLAEGKYAQDILSWGELAYISMNNGLIAGLGRDGSLKLAGPLAEQVEPETADWTGLVALRVGGVSSYGDMVLNAMDSQGVCYRLAWEEHGGMSVSQCSEDAGPSTWWYKFAPDGSVTKSSGDNGAWEPYDG